MGLHPGRKAVLYVIPVLLISACILTFTRTAEREPITVFKGLEVTINCTLTDRIPEGMAATLKRGNHSGARCYLQWQEYNWTNDRCQKHTDFVWHKDENLLYFILKNLSVNDSDVYSCDVEQIIPPPPKITEGDKTYVTVLAPPTVEVRTVSSPAQSSIQLICTAKDFFPSDIELQWHKDGELFRNGTENRTRDSTRNVSYSLTSILTISASDWKENELFSCLVNHSTLTSLIVQSISWQNHTQAVTNTFNLNIWLPLVVAGFALLIAVTTILVLKRCLRAQLKSSLQSSKTMPPSERATPLPVQESKATDHAIYSMVGEHQYHHTT